MGLFDMIAPVYGLFYNYQKKHYSAVLDNVQNELDLSKYISIIDVGCGTGALCAVLHQRGFEVTGIDPSKKMLNVAMGKQENKAIQFIQASALDMLPFPDKSFDFSIASYVAHGLKGQERSMVYNEMSRITKSLVIIYDYNQNRSIFTNIIEWLEGGDYFNFIRDAKMEMKEHFQDVREIQVSKQANWYLCTPKG